MARFKYDEADKYGSGGTRFFSLKEDKETAQVRFMYETVDDIECFNVHQFDVKGEAFKKRYINCLRSYRDPLDVCPLCAAKKPTRVKLIVPMYNVETQQVQLWDRGKKFINQLTSLFSRYSASGKSICSNIFDVERNGKKGDNTTTYSMYFVKSDDTTMEDLPDVSDVLGSLIEDMSAEDMERFLESDGEGNEPPVNRRESRRQDDGEREEEYERPVRRTPGRRAYN